MKTIITWTAAFVTLAALAFAGVPQTINYQGYLKDGSGKPVNGTVGMTFRLYSSVAPVNPLWSGASQDVTATNGIYSTQIGPTNLPFDRSYWVGVSVEGEPVLAPLQQLTSVPYAFRSLAAGCNPWDMLYCYAAPINTMNVSACKAGMRICNQEGTAFGSCIGAVLPGREICDGIDNDCDILIDNNNICTPPSFTGTTPTSPSATLTPTINGTAPANSTVTLFTNPSCSGPPIASGGTTGASFSIPVTVVVNTLTQYYAKATDSLGDSSPCSSGSITYSSDITLPATPVISSSIPLSPTNASSTPTFNGSAESGTTVTLYQGNACQTLVSTGTAANGSFSIAVPVPLAIAANTSTQFTVKSVDASGNTTLCSAPFTYTYDTSAPTPIITGSNPTSPGLSGLIRLFGFVTVGLTNTTVYLYNNSECSGTPLNSVPAASFSNSALGFSVPVNPNSTTSFYVNTRDAAGNISLCSESFSYTAL